MTFTTAGAFDVSSVKDLGNRKVSLLKFHRLSNLPVGTTAFTSIAARLEPVGYSLIIGSYEESNPNDSRTI